ncbi:MAG TPA: hypothetical protein VN915_04310 [Elusimicrobiota bacterium]|nr:hypothetical protein [Elusimicrobiota bacterium]
MRRGLALAAVLLCAVPALAGFFGRSKLVSRWTAAKLSVNGDDADWADSSAFEEDGLAVMAMNDASDLYLIVTAHTRDARDQLGGESRQDLTLWFVKEDGKTRDWGARIPYGHRAPLTSSLRDPAGIDPEPELVHYDGAQISSGTLPGDIVDRLAEQGRRPIWELKVPLKRVAVISRKKEKSVDLDVVLNAPPGGGKRAAQPRPRSEDRDGREGRSDYHPEEQVWNAQSYTLSIRLAPDPAAAPH